MEEISGEIKKVAALAGVAIGAAIFAALLLGIGGALFYGEWVFGSIGWGILHGVLFLGAIAVSSVVIAAGIEASRIGIGVASGFLVAIAISIILGANLTNLLWSVAADNILPLAAEDIRPLAAAVVIVPVVLGALLGLLNFISTLASDERRDAIRAPSIRERLLVAAPTAAYAAWLTAFAYAYTQTIAWFDWRLVGAAVAGVVVVLVVAVVIGNWRSGFALLTGLAIGVVLGFVLAVFIDRVRPACGDRDRDHARPRDVDRHRRVRGYPPGVRRGVAQEALLAGSDGQHDEGDDRVGEGTDAALAKVVAARANLAEEVDRLEAAGRAAVDIPAKIRRSPAKAAAIAGGGAFLVLGGPKRVFRRARKAITGHEDAPLPKTLLPKDIEKTLKRLGTDGDKVRGTDRARLLEVPRRAGEGAQEGGPPGGADRAPPGGGPAGGDAGGQAGRRADVRPERARVQRAAPEDSRASGSRRRCRADDHASSTGPETGVGL